MKGAGALGRVLASLLRLVVFAVVVGVVVALLMPGGPLDPGSLDGFDGSDPRVETASDGGAGAATVTATPPDRPMGRSPWGEEVLVVAVRNPADPSRNVTPSVADALAYWEENAGYADYAATFRLEPDAEDPDVVVWYNATMECANHDDAIGCAPLLQGSESVDRPVHVQVRYERNDNRRQVRNTAIHEFGHVLGVTHCEEPYWVMASACAEPVPAAPDATDRALAWREPELSVYIDDANVSASEREATNEQIGHALAYFENASDDEFPADVTLTRTDDRFAADVTVVFWDEEACRQEAVVCYTRQGRDFDRDGRMEYFTSGNVRVSPGTDVEARGWYVAWALAHQLSPGNVPRVLHDDEASYRERRSEWWE